MPDALLMMDHSRLLLSSIDQRQAADAADDADDVSEVSSSATSGIGSYDSKEIACTNNSQTPQEGQTMGGSRGRLGSAGRRVDEDEEGLRPLDVTVFVPPDGGLRAWLVMISSFLCNAIIFGIINSFGVIFVFLKREMPDDDSAAAKASLVGAMAVGATFLLSPVSGILADRFGIRRTAFVGGCVATLGMFLSAFCVHRIDLLCVTYGVLFGGGSSLCYTPSLVILGHYFRKRMGIVNGIVTAGSSLCTMVMPFLLDWLLESVGLSTTLLVLSGLTSVLILASFSFKPLMSAEMTRSAVSADKRGCCAQIVNVQNWRNKKYLIWALAIPSALFGYFVPYVHIVQYVKDILPESNGNSLVTCIGITSGVGRVVFGFIADWPRTNRVLLQQISFVAIGLCTMLLTAAPYLTGFEFQALIGIALVMGLFDGCFITMLGPIAFDICGPAGASQAIGFLLGMCSVPLTVGPPIAGLLYDVFGNYKIAFLGAGCPPIIGALFMCLIYVVKAPSGADDCESASGANGGAEVAGGAEAAEGAEGQSLLHCHGNGHALKTAATSSTIVGQEEEEERDSI